MTSFPAYAKYNWPTVYLPNISNRSHSLLSCVSSISCNDRYCQQVTPKHHDLHETTEWLNDLTSMRNTLFCLAMVVRSFTCLEFIAKGFSHRTFFPALRNSWPTCQCSVCSTPMYTMSVRTQMFQAQLQAVTPTRVYLCLCSQAIHSS